MAVTGNKRMANRPANGHNNRFKPGNRRMNMGGIGAMFNILNNTNQIPSNGYLDFTEPTSNNMSNNSQKQFKNNSNNANNGSATNGNSNKNRNMQRRNNNNGQRNGGGMNNNMNGNNRWGNNNRGGMGNNNRNNGMRQGGNMMQFNGPPRMHPMGPNGPMPPMLPPLPMPIHNMNGRFPPRPLMPPPMGIGMGQNPMRPPNFRMGPFPNRGMMPRNNAGGPIRRNNKVAGGMVNKANRRNVGNAQSGPKNRKKNQVKNGKRANPNVNKYALDRPWVNDEIREAHQAKTDLENQLKGKKNDEIFAKFKEQRDKFVSLYDAAKVAFVTTQKKDKEKVSKESDTGEQKDTSNDVELPIASAAS